MKILCNYTPAGPHYVRTGWKRVFEALGHQFLFWRTDQKSAFDVFSEYEPDMYIGTTYETNRAICKNIVKRPEMKVAMFASAWGPYLNDVDLEKYPLVVVTEQEKQCIEALKKATGKPDYVFIHAHGPWLEGTMSGWSSIGVPYIGILNAADTFVYLNGKKRPELQCDLAFVGGYWGYKAGNLDRYLLPLCHPTKQYSVKIFGNQQWPVAQYLGGIDDANVPDLFASATICPNVSEPHSTDLGFDCIERIFKTLSSGGFCISDHVAEGRELFAETELPMATDPQCFSDMIEHYLKNPAEREPIVLAGRSAVLAKHTYFHRVAQMFENFGMRQESKRCMEICKQFLKASSITV